MARRMILEIQGVSKTYHTTSQHEVKAIDDVSLEVSAGEFVAVHGPSGSGKTTLLLMAGGLLAPDAGTVRVAGTDLYQLPSDRRARIRASHVGFVFQQFHLVPYLSVFDNVLAPAVASGKADLKSRAQELLHGFGLANRVAHTPSELSTGERQRTALARALLNEPELLLADEPTGNLDRKNSEAVLKHLKEFAKSGGAVLLVTHEEFAMSQADRLVEIRNVRINDKADWEANRETTSHRNPQSVSQES